MCVFCDMLEDAVRKRVVDEVDYIDMTAKQNQAAVKHEIERIAIRLSNLFTGEK